MGQRARVVFSARPNFRKGENAEQKQILERRKDSHEQAKRVSHGTSDHLGKLGLLEQDLVGRGLLEVVESSPETRGKEKGQYEIEWRPEEPVKTGPPGTCRAQPPETEFWGPGRFPPCCLPSSPQSLSDLASIQVAQLWSGGPSVCM